MAGGKADSIVVPCSEARQHVWIEFAMVLIPLPVLLTGDLVVALMGGALAALLLSVAIRMWRARVQIIGDDVMVRGTWRTQVYEAEAIESVSIRRQTARFWSWAWDGNLPPFRPKDLLVFRFVDGSELVPEATRRPPGLGRDVLDAVSDALGLAPSQS